MFIFNKEIKLQGALHDFTYSIIIIPLAIPLK
jgi:hypothetical protein